MICFRPLTDSGPCRRRRLPPSYGSTVIVPISGEPIRLALHGGFLQIFQNEVTLLTDRAEISQGDADEARELAAQFAAAEDDEV